MTVMVAETYDALRRAGAHGDKARKAAEAVGDFRSEKRSIEARLSSEMHGIKLELNGIKLELKGVGGEIATLKWMNGGLLAVAVAIFIRMLFG